jgi:REP element-mobilizing transposase RayT
VVVRRRSPLRLQSYDYELPGAYFFTACMAGRGCVLGSVVGERMLPNALGDAVRRCWEELPRHVAGFALDAFVVMPNHVHGIIFRDVGAGHDPPLHLGIANRRDRGAGHDPPLHLGMAIGLFKSASGRIINEVRGTPGQRVWQRGYFERVIRSDAEHAALRRYIAENPLRWALDRENPERRGP